VLRPLVETALPHRDQYSVAVDTGEEDRQDLPPGRRAPSINDGGMTTGDTRLKSQVGAGRRHEPVPRSLDHFE
jgi:hypothetical protein